jgi:hypothetical protein
MQWLEIIELRAVRIDQDVVQEQVGQFLKQRKNKNVVRIYINARVKTDWSIHVQHNKEPIETQGSDVCRQLKEILKEWGLVNYSIWGKQPWSDYQTATRKGGENVRKKS